VTTAEILAEAGVSREDLGRAVRAAWIVRARRQPHPKPSWLESYDNLSPAGQEAGNQIGEALFAAGWFARAISRQRELP
jgi:hypothetical protein